MCNYCDTDIGNAEIFKDDAYLIDIMRRPIFVEEIYALRIKMVESQMGFVININYCPMCRKKAR